MTHDDAARDHGVATRMNRALAVMLTVVVALAVAGCTQAAKKPAMKAPSGGSGMVGVSNVGSSGAMPMAKACAGCGGKTIPLVEAVAGMDNGVQVVKVGIKDGHYEPNRISAKAGVPLKLVFSGTAKGCPGKPKFPALKKQADFTSGSATLDMGVLAAGTYELTCGMGSHMGSLVVR